MTLVMSRAQLNQVFQYSVSAVNNYGLETVLQIDAWFLWFVSVQSSTNQSQRISAVCFVWHVIPHPSTLPFPIQSQQVSLESTKYSWWDSTWSGTCCTSSRFQHTHLLNRRWTWNNTTPLPPSSIVADELHPLVRNLPHNSISMHPGEAPDDLEVAE